MNLHQDCLDAMEIAVREINSSPAIAFQILSKVVESIAPCKGVEYNELRALALYNRSRALERLSQPDDARRCREEAAAQLDEAKAPGAMLAIQDRLADTLIELGEFRRAIPFCEQAIALSGSNAIKVADRLWRVGRTYVRAGFKQQAEEPLGKALEIFRTQASDPRTPVVLIDLGNAVRSANPSQAESCYTEAARIWEGANRLGQATTAWVNLGVLCAELDRLPEALGWYRKARAVREADPATPPARLGSLHNNIANVYRRMGAFEQAVRDAESAIRLLEPQGDPLLAEALGTRGLIFRDQNADEDALAWFRKARAEHEKRPSPNVSQLAETLENERAALARLGRLAEASAVEQQLAQLRGAAPPFRTHDLGPLKTKVAGTEGTVLIELDGRTLPDAVYRNYDLKTIEDQLLAIVEEEALGELDGHEFGPETTTIFLYGADAEAVFHAVEPALRNSPLCDGARVTIRQGVTERHVVITSRSR
jgi:tetratricopeptide (TPR) repeat protein